MKIASSRSKLLLAIRLRGDRKPELAPTGKSNGQEVFVPIRLAASAASFPADLRSLSSDL
ncbi:MAG: hypothetical protein C4576_35705 [Desulfobacteraceae bacterium]|nr:MAG: hypothetical protein C4576_35705 [Desulfobacteraceae bacterium]